MAENHNARLLWKEPVEETRKEVGHNLSYLMPGGGFIFGATNSVQFGAKTDNYLAAIDSVRTKGRY